MTPIVYWTLWATAGCVFLVALGVLLHFVVTGPILAALERLH